jgi:Fe-Mn family superoxide dismutase
MVPVGAQQRPPAFLDTNVMRDAWITEGKALFGSGWVWLSLTRDGKLVVEALPNADLPQRQGHTPILVMDLWEHAYYCQYGTNREEFLKNTFHLLNWRIAEQRLAAAGGI